MDRPTEMLALNSAGIPNRVFPVGVTFPEKSKFPANGEGSGVGVGVGVGNNFNFAHSVLPVFTKAFRRAYALRLREDVLESEYAKEVKSIPFV